MEIIVFALVFVIITLSLYKHINVEEETGEEFDLTFVKGTTRGSTGMITSMDSMDALRERLNSKGSKF